MLALLDQQITEQFPEVFMTQETNTSRTFEFLLNALEMAGADPYPYACGYGDKRKAVFACVAKLETDLAAALVDAERYRWLRHGDNDESVLHFTNDCPAGTDTVWILRNEELDAAIDTARSKSHVPVGGSE